MSFEITVIAPQHDLSSSTPAELAVFSLPPLTEAEIAVLGPRHEYFTPRTPVRASRPDDPKHTCMDNPCLSCPACEATEIEKLVETAVQPDRLDKNENPFGRR